MKQHVRLLLEYLKVTLASAMEYRLSFFIQVFSMVFNDFVWIVFWWIFIERFESINGWQLREIILIYAIITIAYGLTGVFFGNRSHIHEIVSEGRLDFYLNLPKNELFHVLCSRSSAYALGDILFGVIMAVFALELAQLPLFLVLVLTSATLIVSFGILVGSLSFYMGNATETTRTLWMGLMTFSSYPITIFGTVARVLLLTIFPAGLIASVPILLLQGFVLQLFLYFLGVTLLFFVVSLFVFYRGLRKYESGSMITIRT